MTCIEADEGAGVSWRPGGAGAGVRPVEQAADAESLVVLSKPWWRRKKPAHLEMRPPPGFADPSLDCKEPDVQAVVFCI